MTRAGVALAAFALSACSSRVPTAAVPTSDAAAADGRADVSDAQRKDSEPGEGVADLGAAPDLADATIDYGQPLRCHPTCAFTDECIQGVCQSQIASPVSCRLATDPPDSATTYICDFALACTLTASGDLTCEQSSAADSPCNGGSCGSHCACTDPTHRTCTCYKPDAGPGSIEGGSGDASVD